MIAGRRSLVLALVVVTCACEAASAVTPRYLHHWRRRALVPPLPYPEALHPLDQPLLPSGFTMTAVHEDGEPPGDPATPIARPRDVASLLAACWAPPPEIHGAAREVTIRIAFDRAGSPIGPARITYVAAGQDAGGNAGAARQAMVASITSALAACTPLRFTGSLGAAIAGVPFAIRFIARAPANP